MSKECGKFRSSPGKKGGEKGGGSGPARDSDGTTEVARYVEARELDPSLAELGAFGVPEGITVGPSEADGDTVVALPIDAVTLPEARRIVLNAEVVELLARSIHRTGLQHPIRVAADAESGTYTVIAGAHRFAAHKCLGLDRVNAIIVVGDPIELELNAIEENLARRHLTILERALMERRWKELYLLGNPLTRRGTAGGLARHGEQPTALSFAGLMATDGSGRRSVERRLQIAEALAGEVAVMLASSSIGNNLTQLLALTRQPPQARKAIAALIVEAKATSIKDAVRQLSGVAKAAKAQGGKTVRARLERTGKGHTGMAVLRGRLVSVNISSDLTSFDLTDGGQAPTALDLPPRDPEENLQKVASGIDGLRAALIGLGYESTQARAAAHRLSGRYNSEPFDVLLKEAVASLTPCARERRKI